MEKHNALPTVMMGRMDGWSENVESNEAILTEGPPPQCTSMPLVCLNFKVPLRVRQQFKIYAARHNLTMTELLLQLLDDCLTSGANRGQPQPAHK
jgi:hypothetical protein